MTRPYALPHKRILEYIDEIYDTSFQEKRNDVLMNYKERIQKDIDRIKNEDEGLEEDDGSVETPSAKPSDSLLEE